MEKTVWSLLSNTLNLNALHFTFVSCQSIAAACVCESTHAHSHNAFFCTHYIKLVFPAMAKHHGEVIKLEIFGSVWGGLLPGAAAEKQHHILFKAHTAL